MSGRGDNNIRGSSGQGASNQSGQGFEQIMDRQKANHGTQTGGKPSQPQPRKEVEEGNRNISDQNQKK